MWRGHVGFWLLCRSFFVRNGDTRGTPPTVHEWHPVPLILHDRTVPESFAGPRVTRAEDQVLS